MPTSNENSEDVKKDIAKNSNQIPQINSTNTFSPHFDGVKVSGAEESLNSTGVVRSSFSGKGNKIKKVLRILLLILVIFIILGFLGYFLRNYGLSASGINKVQEDFKKGKIAGYDTRLLKFYLTTKKLGRDEIINLAKHNCFEVKISPESKISTYYEYQRDIRNKILLLLGLNLEKSIGLLFVYDEVPETDKCWLAWVVDEKGQGIVGYETKDSKMELFYSTLPKTEIDNVLKNIKI
jgi:hypothetical protein